MILILGQTKSAPGQTNERPAAAHKGKAIICLTYDDALESQLANAVPQLDSFHFKGMFFINSIAGSSSIIGQGPTILIKWKSVSGTGHELGNHTLFHPCPAKFGWQKEVALDTYSISQLLNEIEVSNFYLRQIDRKFTKRSFAYPCNNFFISGIDYSDHLRKLNYLSCARAGGDANSVVVDLKTIDKYKVPSWHVKEGTTAESLIAFSQRAIDSTGLAIYQFHDIGGPLFEVSKESHRALLSFLRDNEDKIWVATFSEVVAYIESQSKE